MWKPQGIYSDFMLAEPAILWGKNAARGLLSFPCARVAVVHGKSLNEELAEMIKTVFKKKSLAFIERSWSGEPDLEGLKGTIADLERFKPDAIIAVGGGSVIDGTKICRLFYEFPFFVLGKTKLNQLAFKTNFIVIPTTIGSGAEVSSAAVYINKEKRRKEMVISHELQPSAVVLNPEYVYSVPEEIMTASFLDAIGHIVEGYVSNRNNELTDIYAEKALNILYHEFSKKERGKREYQRIQYAGLLGGIVQNHCIVGLAHAIAHQITSYGFTHGTAVALLLSGVISINCEDEKTRVRYNLLCERAGIGDIDDLKRFIDERLYESGIGKRKEEIKKVLVSLIDREDYIKNVIDDMGGRGNPNPITEDLIRKLTEVYM